MPRQWYPSIGLISKQGSSSDESQIIILKDHFKKGTFPPQRNFWIKVNKPKLWNLQL